MTSPPDDAVLVARCRDGDETAWSALVHRYQRLVYAIVMRAGLDPHAAADVFQTVFSRLVTHLGRIQQPERLQAWIVTTAKREALLMRARNARTTSLTRDEEGDGDGPDFEVADPALLPEEELSELQQADRVRRALDRLDERCRALLLLLFEAEVTPSYDEVAIRLGMAVGSIGPTRGRCIAKLRQLLD